MSAKRFDDEIVYAPEIISDDMLNICETMLRSFKASQARDPALVGGLIEALDVLLTAVKKLQSIDYVLAPREVVRANLRTHANFPIQGSKRLEDADAGVPRDRRRDCDCDLCIDGRRALYGKPRTSR
jgi:hypothetical protein